MLRQFSPLVRVAVASAVAKSTTRVTTLSTLAMHRHQILSSPSSSLPPCTISTSFPSCTSPSASSPSSSTCSAMLSVMRHGGLISSSVIDALLAHRLSCPDAVNGFILDGYPRTVSQADSIDTTNSIFLVLDAPDTVARKRILSRASKSTCPRPDDTPDVADARLATYRSCARQIYDVLQEKNATVVFVDADQAPINVAADALKVLDGSTSKNVVLMGPPGVGKGTVAVVLSEMLKVPHVSTGGLVRDFINNAEDVAENENEFHSVTMAFAS